MNNSAKKAFILIFLSLNFVCSAENIIKNVNQNNQEEKQKITLKKENAKFSTVLNGKAIARPEETSYGFCVLTDAKTLTAISNSGKILWEKKVHGNPEDFLTVLQDDFIIYVSDKKNLSFVNPSGKLLWRKTLPFNICKKPFSGRDGRIFARGNKNLSCVSINGILKWNITTPEQSEIAPEELNDGTLLVFLKETENGLSKALRVSPFGEIIAAFTFSGKVSNAFSCKDGVILSFEGGGFGLCSVEDNSTLTKWVTSAKNSIFVNTENHKAQTFIPVSKTKTVIAIPLLKNQTRFIIFENKTGKITSIFDSDQIEIQNKTFSGKTETDGSFFVSDLKNAVIFNEFGKILYSVSLPQNKKSWNYILCSSSNTLLLSEPSWLFLGWKTIQTSSKQKNKTFKTKYSGDYSDFYATDTSIFKTESSKIDRRYADEGRTELLKQGNYGVLEEKWTSIILSAYKAYSDFSMQKTSSRTRSEPSVFETDTKGTEILLNQLALLGTDLFSKEISRLLSSQKNPSHLIYLVRAVKLFGYDPDSKILNSLEKVLQETSSINSTLLCEICDAVYEICVFMGRPALYSHGKEMISTLLYPKYDSKVREKARKTLIKIADSGI